MSKRFTISDLQRSKSAGLNKHVFPQTAEKYFAKVDKNIPAVKKPSTQKAYIHWNLMYWCNEHAVILEEEHKFHPNRKWRFDWAIPALKIAVEYEGLGFNQVSRHTTSTGFTGDTEKYNSAVGLGWKVLRFTAQNYKNLITELNKLIK